MAATAALLAALQPGGEARAAQDGSADAEAVDPWEGFNRRMHAFNEWFDHWIFIPVATGWDHVFPDFVETRIQAFFDNLDMVIVLGNDVLQLKPLAAGQDVARIAINSTVGLAGFFDVASRLDVPENDEDFGQTLGYWGLPAGPFLMLPVFGPSSPRDTLGLAVDTASRPWTYFIPWYASTAATIGDRINDRAIYLEEIAELRATTLDYYVFLRDAWLQSRRLAVEDLEAPPEETEEDLYYFDDDEEWEEEPEPSALPGNSRGPGRIAEEIAWWRVQRIPTMPGAPGRRSSRDFE